MGAEPCGSAPLGCARCPRRVGLGRMPPRRVGLGCMGPPPRVTPLLLRLFVLGWVETLVLHLFNPPSSPGPLILHDGRPIANVGISLVGGWEREGFVKMKYDFCRTSFL